MSTVALLTNSKSYPRLSLAAIDAAVSARLGPARTVALVNAEPVEMMELIRIPRTACFDIELTLNHSRHVIGAAQAPRRSTTVEPCAASSDRGAAALGKEAPAVE